MEEVLKKSVLALPVACLLAGFPLLVLLYLGISEPFSFLVAGLLGGCYIGVKSYSFLI